MSHYPRILLPSLNIESGSLWADLLGYPKIITLMESFIVKSALYTYRNFTKEGKVSSIPRQVRAIESILNLRDKLQKEGLETEHLDESIQKSSIIIAKELNRLLSGEPQITIDGQLYGVSHELEEKFIAQSEVLSLSDGSIEE